MFYSVVPNLSPMYLYLLYTLTLFADCQDLLISGLTGAFIPDEDGDYCTAGADHFSSVTYPADLGHVVFVSTSDAYVSEFLLKFAGVCSDGSAVTATVVYFSVGYKSEPVSLFS